MIKFYLNTDKCIELSEVLYSVRDEAIKELVKDKKSRIQLFNCLTEVPDLRSYEIAKGALNKSRDAEIYFSLERIALLLDNVDDAYEYVQKIDMVNNEKIKEKEFLYRFQVYGKLNSNTSIKQFFRYTTKHPEYIKINKDNPLIIDFYYQYYLFMKQQNKTKEALMILNELYDTQNKMKAYVYSPFVELELSKNAKLNDDYDGALSYLESSLDNTRKIKDNDLANIYYDMAKIYEKLNKKERYKVSIEKCKALKNANSLYKTMCDKL
jgi:tetratricopeptide (TPR) repeat protein